MTAPTIFRTVADMRAQVADWRGQGLRIGLVPTMGGLHDGHMTLVRNALSKSDRVITTIFVNPTQFGEGEDLDSYPRTEAKDSEMIGAAGGQAVFIPSVREMYPDGFSTRVMVDGLTTVLCGATRPGHFDGVSQVVTKLLNQAGADMAFFGEKDWQQLAVIRRLARDLDIATEIAGVPTVRDEYGLALSSRNGYLSDSQIDIARHFNVVLKKAAYDIATGGFASEICTAAGDKLLSLGFEKIDYIECRDAVSLETVERADLKSCRIFGAAYLGRARLIDNHLVV
ncbi:pantothenate synthetase [Amylibacter ulvae]|uniref:Pantothenate synthetase n=1 Tax=Paramylibacter ulvae TaxID=1651968 RepID=A0ABQ3CW05_9RHOB|nr:pantoate--beta-alanine ligase [Amylibacter ulvae]GHA45070.1 pantothenate synthetase [Amylibacter ulvae]